MPQPLRYMVILTFSKQASPGQLLLLFAMEYRVMWRSHLGRISRFPPIPAL
jgi:hypothetical protein